MSDQNRIPTQPQIPENQVMQPEEKKQVLFKSVLGLIIFIVVAGASYAGYFYYKANRNQKDISDKIPVNEQTNIDNNINVEETAAKNEKTCPPYNFDDTALEEETAPGDVAMRLYRALKENNYDYISPHMYCDESCQKMILDELGLCLNEFWELDKKISAQSKEVKILELSSDLKQKDENKVTYELNYKFTHLEPDGKEQEADISGKEEYELIKKGKMWKMDLGHNLGYLLVALRHYQKMFNDLEKCRSKAPIEYTVPILGGQLEINDSDHPLNGLKIKFPKLKEPLTIKVSCLEKFPPVMTSDFHVTLPISIEINKDIDTLNKELLELSQNSPHNEEEYSIDETRFQYSLPYYDIGFNDESGFAHMQGANDIMAGSRKTDLLYPTEIVDAKNNYLSAKSSVLYKIIFADASIESLKPPKNIDSTDTDRDGIADNIEEIFGTDKTKNDSDGDGFLDGDEVRNGYNPIGEGKISLEEPKLENKILYSMQIYTKTPEGESMPPTKIYSYDVTTGETKEIVANADRYFSLTSDHKKIMYKNPEHPPENSSESGIVIFDLITGERKISSRESIVMDSMLWKDIYLQRENITDDVSSIFLYNERTDKKAKVLSYPGTALFALPGKKGSLFCSGYANSYRIDLLRDRIDKEYEFNAPVLYITLDARQLLYLKESSAATSSKIYIYDDEKNTSKRLTELDDSYYEFMSIQPQMSRKLLFMVYKFSSEKIKVMDTQMEFQIGIYDPITNKIDYIKEKGIPISSIQDMNSVISPDGKSFAYFDYTNKKLVIYDIDGKRIAREISLPDRPAYMIWY